MHVHVQNHFLRPSQYNRPGRPMEGVTAYVVHYVEGAKYSARGIQRYFDRDIPAARKYASSHYILDLNGLILCAVPPDEIAYHAGGRKYTAAAREKFAYDYPGRGRTVYPHPFALGIECCHVNREGLMSRPALVALETHAAVTLAQHGLNETALMRHYDVTTKPCHHWFVRNPSDWEIFVARVGNKIRASHSLKVTEGPYFGDYFESDSELQSGDVDEVGVVWNKPAGMIRTVYPVTDEEAEPLRARVPGSAVFDLQRDLRTLGYREVGRADGWFGPGTKDAVAALQRQAGRSLESRRSDGVVDGATRRLIRSRLEAMLLGAAA